MHSQYLFFFFAFAFCWFRFRLSCLSCQKPEISSVAPQVLSRVTVIPSRPLSFSSSSFCYPECGMLSFYGHRFIPSSFFFSLFTWPVWLTKETPANKPPKGLKKSYGGSNTRRNNPLALLLLLQLIDCFLDSKWEVPMTHEAGYNIPNSIAASPSCYRHQNFKTTTQPSSAQQFRRNELPTIEIFDWLRGSG